MAIAYEEDKVNLVGDERLVLTGGGADEQIGSKPGRTTTRLGELFSGGRYGDKQIRRKNGERWGSRRLGEVLGGVRVIVNT